MNQETIATPISVQTLAAPLREETTTGQSRRAYQLAALVLFVGVGLEILDVILFKSARAGGLPILIDVVLAIGLLQFRAGARTWVLFRAALGAIIWPIWFFVTNDPLSAVFMTIAQWGSCGALILLLTGQSKPWRLVLAVAVFAAFTLSLYALTFLLIALGALLQIPLE